jgi:hypothetical protein
MSISTIKEKSECVGDCCLAPFEQHFSYIMGRTIYIRWDDSDNDSFILDEHAWLDLYTASSLKRQPESRHVTQVAHIILIPSQHDFDLPP